MAGLEDLIRSSAPGGNLAKPLMIALGALLASGVLFGGGNAAQPTTGAKQVRAKVLVVSWRDLVGYWPNCSRAGSATRRILGSAPAKINRYRLANSVRRLARTADFRLLLSYRA